mgnify:CR=1 FL=1
MSYLLDTCLISEATKPKPNAAVIEWIRGAEPESLYVSVLSLGEIERGVERLGEGQRKRHLRIWLEQVREESAGRVLGIDDRVATEWGRMSARAEARGEILPVIDALLGATAAVHGLTIVTRNTSDLVRTGAPILDPWAP